MIKTISQKENMTTTSKLRQSDKGLLTTSNFSIKDALNHVSTVKMVIESTQSQLQAHREKIEEARALIALLSDKSQNSNEELLTTLKVNFERIYNNFTVQIALQRQENEKMQQKIDKLKKEKTEIQQIIIICAQRCAELEQELGKYPI